MLRNKLRFKSCLNLFNDISLRRIPPVSTFATYSNEPENDAESFWPERIRAKFQLIEFFKNNVLFVNPKPDDDEELNLTVTKILPDLAKEFNRDELFLVKSVPRKCSGIIIFASSDEAKEHLSNSIKICRSWNLPNIKLLCICVGKPIPSHGEEELRIDRQEINDQLIHVVGDCVRPSNTKLKSKVNKMAQFRYRTLAKGNDCSLVELFTNSLSWHSHRLFLSSKGSPILGDSLYQQRVARILGKSVQVDPKRASAANQYIPLEILKTLQISVKEYHKLPLYSFAQEILLPKLLVAPKLKQNLKLESPVPEYFRTALKLLFGDIDAETDFSE